MRLEARFARPLDRQGRIRCALAAAALAKTRSVRFPRGDRSVVVLAHELSRERLRQALADEGLECDEVVSSLVDDSRCDEAGEPERVRAPGR
ncbi:MAG: hypothetical protein RLZZ127_2339 [Planctomycetota bacterium]